MLSVDFARDCAFICVDLGSVIAMSMCRPNVDSSLHWMMLTVDLRSLCTPAIDPQELLKKGVVVLDFDAAIVKCNVST